MSCSQTPLPLESAASRNSCRSDLPARERAVVVSAAATDTDAVQQNRNLLLSESAVANSRPQLEIFTDQVKCAHGATVGQLDADAVYYLRSRGLSEEEARNMLIFGFADEIASHVESPPIREMVRHEVRAWLAEEQQ